MPVSSSSVSDKVQALLSQRSEHEQAIAAIDHRLAQIAEILGAPITPRRRPGRPKGSGAVAAIQLGRPRKRTRTRYAVSGEQSILNYIKANKNPTTKEIKAHWASESRKGSGPRSLAGGAAASRQEKAADSVGLPQLQHAD